MSAIIECVPNFSEGRNLESLERIADAIRSVEGVKLLHIDRGEAANRTVMTFAGSVEQVFRAALLAIEVASRVIDMRNHRGEHPRIGATDVMPFVPVSGITLDELVPLVHDFGRRVGRELGVPVYFYEAAALQGSRRGLEACRRGEYEGLPLKMASDEWNPDCGPTVFDQNVAKTGLSVIGARDFLVAVNFNLDTSDVEFARRIACTVRSSGYVLDGVRTAGTLPSCKAIGWYIAEYGCAQVSTNLTDINITSLHVAYAEISRVASLLGVRVTGTEIIGLVPLSVLRDAGRYFSDEGSTLNDEQLIGVAIESMGLDDLCPFDPQKKIIEYLL